MDFQKFFSFLTLSILVLCQVGRLQAAPFRSALESSADKATLGEEEVRLLLAALVKDLVQMKAGELEQEQEQEAEGSSLDSPRSKRCGNLSTCVLGTHSQDLNNFHTFSGTDFGAETPGKKRDIASGLDSPHSGLPQNAK